MLVRPTCVLCGVEGSVVCARCGVRLCPAPALPPPLGVDRCSALLDYRSSGRLLPALKNRARRDLIGLLADGMAALVDLPPDAVVTWAPTTAHRQRTRGFDQAQLLASAVARRLGARCLPLLTRVGGPAQAGRSASERSAHAGFISRRAAPDAVLLVDDVVTTGATLSAASRTLRVAGATAVHAVVAARAASPGTAPESDLRWSRNAPDPEVPPTWTSP